MFNFEHTCRVYLRSFVGGVLQMVPLEVKLRIYILVNNISLCKVIRKGRAFVTEPDKCRVGILIGKLHIKL